MTSQQSSAVVPIHGVGLQLLVGVWSTSPEAGEWEVAAESGSSELGRETLADFNCGYHLGLRGAALQYALSGMWVQTDDHRLKGWSSGKSSEPV